MKVNIISNGKAGRDHPIKLEVLLQYREIRDAIMYVTLSPSQNTPIPSNAQELNYFTVNGDKYLPSDPFNSVNKIFGEGSNNSLIANGINIFTFDWNTSFFQPILSDGIISAWLEIDGDPLLPFLPAISTTPQNIVNNVTDYFKENTPSAIAILAFVSIIIIGVVYLASKTGLPKISNIELPKLKISNKIKHKLNKTKIFDNPINVAKGIRKGDIVTYEPNPNTNFGRVTGEVKHIISNPNGERVIRVEVGNNQILSVSEDKIIDILHTKRARKTLIKTKILPRTHKRVSDKSQFDLKCNICGHISFTTNELADHVHKEHPTVAYSHKGVYL